MKLLIVDDHSIVREGVAALLVQNGGDVVVLQAASAALGMAAIDAHDDLDAVLLDLNMPGENGMAALRQIGKRRPDLPVIVLSSSEDPADVREALAAGAFGYLPKSSNPRTLMSALQLVLSGEVYVPVLMLKEVEPRVGGNSSPQRGEKATLLTERQVDVLRLLARGMSNKEIGRELSVAERTVKAHVTAIFRSLGVVNRADAVEVATRDALL